MADADVREDTVILAFGAYACVARIVVLALVLMNRTRRASVGRGR